jgi:hypothetical protein
MGWVLPHIIVTRETGTITDQDAIDWCAAVQRQVSAHFRPSWGENASVLFYPDGHVLPVGPHVWRCHLMAHSDVQGAGGYHDDESGNPVLKVFVDDLIGYGAHPSVAFSHEVLEAVADPHCCRAAQVGAETFWALEVCDACEADEFAYPITLPGSGRQVMVSDFVTEAWFTGDPGPYDYMGHIQQAGVLLSGGYIGEWTPQKGWTQKVAQTGTAPESRRIPARALRYPVE